MLEGISFRCEGSSFLRLAGNCPAWLMAREIATTGRGRIQPFFAPWKTWASVWMVLAVGSAVGAPADNFSRTPGLSVMDREAFLLEHARWHQERVQRLMQPDGWLSLVGLYWLEAGETRVGSSAEAPVRLPERAPARLGLFRLEGKQVVFQSEPSVEVRCAGERVDHLVLRDDRDPKPTVLEWKGIRLQLLWRNERYAVRVRDEEAPTRKGFRGIELFPPDPAYRLEAQFEPFSEVRTVEVPTVLGYFDRMRAPGYVRFWWKGQEYRLLALDDTGDGRLFLVFGDLTNRSETYGGGRFLYADPPEKGRVILDFNRAYNPPCAFTPYATCPLPPPENRLPFRVEAGEKRYDTTQHP